MSNFPHQKVGKRLDTSDPLNCHDVAERLTRSAMRTLKILMDIRQTEGDLYAEVRHSRYLLGNLLPELAKELTLWAEPVDLPPSLGGTG